MTPDPVQELVEQLASSLRGPGRARRRLLQEITGGLEDAVDALVAAGLPRRHAGIRAVAEFGPVEQVRDACQDVLSAAQGRRLLLALTAMTVVMPLWHLMIVTSGPLGRPPSPPWLLGSHGVTGAVTMAAAVAGWLRLGRDTRAARSPEPTVSALSRTCVIAVAAHLGAGLATWIPHSTLAARLLLTAPLAPPVVAASCAVLVLTARSTLPASSASSARGAETRANSPVGRSPR